MFFSFLVKYIGVGLKQTRLGILFRSLRRVKHLQAFLMAHCLVGIGCAHHCLWSPQAKYSDRLGEHVNALADLETAIAEMEKAVKEIEEVEAAVIPPSRACDTYFTMADRHDVHLIRFTSKGSYRLS